MDLLHLVRGHDLRRGLQLEASVDPIPRENKIPTDDAYHVHAMDATRESISPGSPWYRVSTICWPSLFYGPSYIPNTRDTSYLDRWPNDSTKSCLSPVSYDGGPNSNHNRGCACSSQGAHSSLLLAARCYHTSRRQHRLKLVGICATMRVLLFRCSCPNWDWSLFHTELHRRYTYDA